MELDKETKIRKICKNKRGYRSEECITGTHEYKRNNNIGNTIWKKDIYVGSNSNG